MAIKASGGNPPQNSLSFTEIEAEFGQNNSRSLGDYRMNNLNIGALTEVSLSRDGCGISADSDIPVDSQTIKFSDFYSAKQNIILDFHTSNQNRVNAKNDKYNASSASGNYIVVGSPGNVKPSSTSGKKVIIHVTKIIGSEKPATVAAMAKVALRTGDWNSGTELLVEVAGGTVICWHILGPMAAYSSVHFWPQQFYQHNQRPGLPHLFLHLRHRSHCLWRPPASEIFWGRR